METRASYLLVGSFVLVLTAALIAVVIWLGGTEFDRKTARYMSYFTGDVTGLGVGNAVRYRGVPVGSVVDIAIDPKNVERVRVIMEVTETTPIKIDTVAQLALQGITGVAFIQLTGGTHKSAALKRPKGKALQSAALKRPKGKALPVIASRKSVIQQVLSRLPTIIEKVLVVADRVTLLFDDKNITAVSKTLENLQ
jgi:phospholipid/cholesterol/gamma-HCH transport system substrate-binding protein